MTINAAANVTIDKAFTAASLNQATAGTGTFKLDDVLTAQTGVVTINANAVDIDADIIASGATKVVSITGATDLGGDITSTNGAVTFNSAVALTDAGRTITTGAGAGTITFASTLDGAQTLALTAGTGNIDFDGKVGDSTALGAVTINSAANVTIDKAFTAASFRQEAGSGTTTFSDELDIASSFTFIGSDLTIDMGVPGPAAVNSDIGGTMEVTNSGTFTLTEFSTLTVGTFTQTGDGNNVIGDDITADVAGINFDQQVTLTSGTADDTIVFTGAGGAGENIELNTVLNADNENLQLVAGEDGDITSNVIDLGITGDLTITSVADATFQDITVEDFTQVAGNGTTTLNGATTTNGSDGFDVTGTNMDVNASITANNAGSVVTDLSGTLDIADAGDITTNTGSVTFDADGGITTDGDIKTNDGSVTFDDATTLSGGVDIDTNNDGADILFNSTIATGGNAFTLDAGPSGDITIKGSVSGGGVFTVRDGNVQSYESLDLGSIEIKDATTSVTFNGQVSTTGSIEVTSGARIIQAAPVNTALSLIYSASQVDISADITTTGDQVYITDLFFDSDVTLTGDSGRFNGDVFTNGYTINFVFNEPVTFPPFAEFSEMTNDLLQFSPGVDLVAQLEDFGLLPSAYFYEYLDFISAQLTDDVSEGDVFFGDGNVLRISPDLTCDDDVCDPLVSIDDVTITPDNTIAVQPASIGELSRTNGPAVFPIF